MPTRPHTAHTHAHAHVLTLTGSIPSTAGRAAQDAAFDAAPPACGAVLPSMWWDHRGQSYSYYS